jgi:hypothetical protein
MTDAQHEAWKAKQARAYADQRAVDASDSHAVTPSREGRTDTLTYPLVALCQSAGLPVPTPEYRFHPARKWRADYAWPFASPRVLVEIDGGAWTQGRHTRGAGFIADQRKRNAAALLGFVTLHYTPDRLAECIGDLRILFAKEAA